MADAIVLFAHGAREPEWAEPFKKIQREVARRLTEQRVELAFLEIMHPALGDTLEKLATEGVKKIRIVPLFLAQGGHLKHDLPKLVNAARKQHPDLSIEVSPAIGEASELLDKIADWVVAEGR